MANKGKYYESQFEEATIELLQEYKMAAEDEDLHPSLQQFSASDCVSRNRGRWLHKRGNLC